MQCIYTWTSVSLIRISEITSLIYLHECLLWILNTLGRIQVGFYIIPYGAHLIAKLCHFRQVFLNTSIHFQVIQNNGSELVITSATFSDTGKYICMVRNNIWLKLVDVWVTVKRTTTSTTTKTTTEPPTTTTNSTTTTAGLQICMCFVYYI